jgi:nucleotide-binding universal stress UspA family protein
MTRRGGLVFQQIVVPVDGSAPSDRSVELAVKLAADLGASLAFCSVIDGQDDVAKLRIAETALAVAATKAQQAGVAFQTRVLQGSVVDRILAFARESAGDLIVMGSHGRVGLERLVLGSVFEGILRESPLPVLVVREPGLA